MQSELLKSHEGLLILGGSHELLGYHELLHDVMSEAPLSMIKRGLFSVVSFPSSFPIFSLRTS